MVVSGSNGSNGFDVPHPVMSVSEEMDSLKIEIIHAHGVSEESVFNPTEHCFVFEKHRRASYSPACLIHFRLCHLQYVYTLPELPHFVVYAGTCTASSSSPSFPEPGHPCYNAMCRQWKRLHRTENRRARPESPNPQAPSRGVG